MKRLWTEEEVEHHGRFFDLHSTRFGPATVQSPHPPIWMGGGAESVLKRVGQHADGYICGSNAVHGFDAVWEKISAHARAAGRNPDDIEKAGLTFIAIDDDKSKAVEACENYLIRYYGKVRMDVEKYMLVGSVDACADGINRIFAGGLPDPHHRPGHLRPGATGYVRGEGAAPGGGIDGHPNRRFPPHPPGFPLPRGMTEVGGNDRGETGTTEGRRERRALTPTAAPAPRNSWYRGASRRSGPPRPCCPGAGRWSPRTRWSGRCGALR